MTSIKFRALTHSDHKLFFEALGEFGKDFQNIQQYMVQKGAKTGSKNSEQNKTVDPQEKKEDDKKREQIRNFYNKLYGKLSQLVGKLDDRVEKVNQELYLLINYGEIWKKHGFKFNNKTKKLLEELVHQGYTTLRFKNKNVRLRTPPCKALKKINEIGVDEKVKVVTTRELPKDVIVEFHPATNRDWLKVQSLSQNPRVRAKLSIQKRLSSVLEFLENKWNLSHERLNRIVDAWLKVPAKELAPDDPQHVSLNCTAYNGGNMVQNHTLRPDFQSNPGCNNATSLEQTASTTTNCDTQLRLRLKPSSHHELKEINITRVVPDNHLDLSLNAYIRRINESKSKNYETTAKSNGPKDSSTPSVSLPPPYIVSDEVVNVSDNMDISQGAMSSSSRLPISLTTPDSSILLERSFTSDQPYIVQARKHLNMLETLAGSFEGCENSRTACEDTQDRTIPMPHNQSSLGFSERIDMSSENLKFQDPPPTVNRFIPALFDENAGIEPQLPVPASQDKVESDAAANIASRQNTLDGGNSRSIDLNIPKNITLGDYFKFNGHGDEANDAFSLKEKLEGGSTADVSNVETKIQVDSKNDVDKAKPDAWASSNLMKPLNHMIEMKKLAEGWTRQEECTITVGELYLVFKCPDKIILEYEFEQYIHKDSTSNNSSDGQIDNEPLENIEKDQSEKTGIVPERPSKNTLIFKLLTAASLSLAQLERQRVEQQNKLHDQSAGKLKRRKGPSNLNTIKYFKRDEGSIASDLFKPSSSRQPLENGGPISFNNLDNNDHFSLNHDRVPGQAMTPHEVEANNQLVDKALKQLQPTRLSVFRRAR